MTALPNYPNVHAIRSRRVKPTPGNSIFAPLAKDPARQLELAEAERIIAPTATQAGMVENAEAPAYGWPAREGYFRKADGFQQIKSQPELTKRPGVSPPVAYAAMFGAAVTVALIMAAFDWLVGAV